MQNEKGNDIKNLNKRSNNKDAILDDFDDFGSTPTKAKNIKKTSQFLIERHNGEVPNTFEELENLPGPRKSINGTVTIKHLILVSL